MNGDGARREASRVPPHNLEAEESLLGAMMLSRDAIAAAVEAGVTSTTFYGPAHLHIHDAIRKLYSQGEPVDPVTVADELDRAGVVLHGDGNRQPLLRLQASTPASANAAHYATIVVELATLRALVAAGAAIVDIGFDDGVESVRASVDRAEQLVYDVAERHTLMAAMDLDEVLQETLDDLEQPSGIRGVRTGYLDVDRLIGGLKPGALYIVAARPGMGKTAYTLGAAVNVAKTTGRPAMFFSMEMGALELSTRLLAAETRIDLKKFDDRRLDEGDWQRVQEAIVRLAGVPLVLDDNPHCTIMEMRAKARRAKQKYGDLALIAVDYVQLMSAGEGRGRAENRQVEVAEISRGLKILARELECPVVACSQLNRQLEYRQEKRPMLADLRESGSQEQDADVVMFLFREEVYAPSVGHSGAEVIVAKNRNGPTDTLHLIWRGRYVTFDNQAPLSVAPPPEEG